MVFFVCSACGSSFKKKQATMHTFRCSSWAYSCMDCGRDFEGHSYMEHNQCITESEKYHGSDHKPKQTVDKNALWIEKVKAHLSKQQPKPFLSKLIGRILEMPSIPRKEKKFVNFVRTNLNVSNEQIITSLWELVSGAMAAGDKPDAPEVSDKENASQNGVQASEESAVTNGVAVSIEKKKKKKKEKTSDEEEIPSLVVASPKKRKKSTVTEESDANEDEAEVSKSKRKRKNKNYLRQSATDEPDEFSGGHFGGREEDFAAVEALTVDTVRGIKKFKWRSTLKQILRAGPSDGMKISKVLHKVEQMYNDPVSGTAIPASRDELRGIMMKNLSKKPFSVANQKAKVGKFTSTDADE